MNNYCRNCGTKIENDSITNCPNCGIKIFTDRINVEQTKKDLELLKTKEKKYITAIIILFILSYVLPTIDSSIIKTNIFLYMSPLLKLAALILLVYARITLKNSKVIKVILIICIIYIILMALIWLILLITCYNTISACVNMG